MWNDTQNSYQYIWCTVISIHCHHVFRSSISVRPWAHERNISCVASGRLHTDGMEEENVMFSLQTKRAIFLTKTVFQLLVSCKLHNILMPLCTLYMESDSGDHSGVGIFSLKEMSWKPCIFVFHCEGKILLTLFGNHIFQLILHVRTCGTHQWRKTKKTK